MSPTIDSWYETAGRHHLGWRSESRWKVLVAEMMLCQTPVGRVTSAWDSFCARFPDESSCAAAALGDVLKEWGNLGYPRRAKYLHEAARITALTGWPANLRELPGVGPWVAAAVAAQADNEDTIAADVNIQRLASRIRGRWLTVAEATVAAQTLGRPLAGRSRFLAVLDVAALVCRRHQPACFECPMRTECQSQGELHDEPGASKQEWVGTMRQRRGEIMAALRQAHPVPVPAEGFDHAALEGLVADGLVRVAEGQAALGAIGA